MPVEPASQERSSELIKNYELINSKLLDATSKRPLKSSSTPTPRLVAVSKLKPSSDILALYNHRVRHFGENYPQELESKSKELPQDIEWHYIGTLQSNKCKMLASIRNLYAIETLTSIKHATQLDNTLSGLTPRRETRLNVFLQINTSGETSKSGLPPLKLEESEEEEAGKDQDEEEVVKVAKHILKECKETLRLKGLMTIGSWDHSHDSDSKQVNPDFKTLLETRHQLFKRLQSQGIEGLGGEEEFELSMGMSNDFEKAIEMGSTNVRIGSDIFGAREPRK
ncbi:hypothetical protein JCM5350_004272 [Sporobolomyces pararoseus]